MALCAGGGLQGTAPLHCPLPIRPPEPGLTPWLTGHLPAGWPQFTCLCHEQMDPCITGVVSALVVKDATHATQILAGFSCIPVVF